VAVAALRSAAKSAAGGADSASGVPGEKPSNLEYSSKIQAISRAPVFMSGAGTSS
jgi:hypothetical protein